MKTQVKRRPFGATGLSVSEVALGAMNLRMLNNRAEGVELVNYVLDQGINLIDTAWAYTGTTSSGEFVASEEIIGSVLESRTDIDEPIVIITKNHGYTPAAFDEEFAVSLERLRVKKTEKGLFIGTTEIKLVVFFHGIKYDRWVEMQESGAIDHAKARQADGDFTYLGFSAHYGDGQAIKEGIESGHFQVMELPYNVYNRSVGEDGELDLIKYAYDHGVAFINMKAFNGNGMVPTAHIIRDVCDLSSAEMLRFNLANPYISTIDAGARWPHEFADDIAASLLPPLTAEERKAIADKADLVSRYFDNICRECTHCLEKFSCPNGLNFPEMLGIYARYKIAKGLGKDTAEFEAQYKALPLPNADDCLQCGACNAFCEYHLDIPAQLAEIREIWG